MSFFVANEGSRSGRIIDYPGMWNAEIVVMSVAQIVLGVMAALVSWFALITLYGELMPALRESLGKTPELTQRGDSSLSPASVNLLGLTAFSAALLICFVLM